MGGLGSGDGEEPAPLPRVLPHPLSAPQEPSSNSLTADNLEKFGKLNHSPGVPEDGALLSEAKLQSIISFLDEMEKSEQERPRSAASATQREVSAGSPSILERWGETLVGRVSHHLVLVAEPGSRFPPASNGVCSPCRGRVSSWKRSWLTWSKRRVLPRRSPAPS